MKKLVFFSILLLWSIFSYAQKETKININNSLVAVSIEVGLLESELTSEGDSKYYSLKPNSIGIGGIKLGQGAGFTAGLNVEFFLMKNARNVALATGAHYQNLKTDMFVSRGPHPNNFFSDWAMRTGDSVAELSVSSIRVPLTLNYYYLIGKRKMAALGIYFGANGYYNFSTKVSPGSDFGGDPISYNKDVKDELEQIYITGIVGAKIKYGRVYALFDISLMNPKKIWKEEYGSEEDTKQTFMNLGVGFYIKK